ncbi:MAG: FAD-dependent monooxygenase, partial [Chloroflexota bacterium]
MHKNHYERAVVIGGSIAGLVTSAVLARHFDRVTVIERDRMPDKAELRKGVPQATQPHILLKRGQMILEDLFPGMTDELIAAGAVPVNMGADLRWFVLDGWRPRFESSMNILGASRPLLETTIREHLKADPKVMFMQETRVIGLSTDADREHVTGVKVDHRYMGEMTVTADLVVDASGRATHAPEWLAELGYVPPEKTAVNARAGYSARYYEIDPSVDFGGMYIQPTPISGARGAVLLPNEGNRWHMALIGIAGDYPPNDEAAFLEFARSLPTPELYNVIKNAKPLTDPVGFRQAENRLYHYDQLPRYLENFVAIGDAVFAFNPVYGQGMTVAAVSALDLDQSLRIQQTLSDDLTGLAEHFQKTLAATLAMPWQLATGEDMRW